MSSFHDPPVYNYPLPRDFYEEFLNPLATPMTSQYSSRSWDSSASQRTSVSSQGYSPTQLPTHVLGSSRHDNPAIATSPVSYVGAQYPETHFQPLPIRRAPYSDGHQLQYSLDIPLLDQQEYVPVNATPTSERRSRPGSDSRHGDMRRGSDTRGAKESERCFCPHRDCRDDLGRPNKTFSRPADVKRHIQSFHEGPVLDCPKPRCERKGAKGFSRRDHLIEHLRGYHAEDVPKRRSSAATYRLDDSSRHER